MGITLYAPAIVLSVILGWPDRVTTLIMGITGGALHRDRRHQGRHLDRRAADDHHLSRPDRRAGHDVWFCCRTTFRILDAVSLAGAAGKLNAVDLKFDWNNRYNVWSGLIGGTFLFLSYFGCDQSQVQRYLTGKSIAQSQLSLLFNAMAKIPMQFFILFIGAMVFVFYLFVQPPLLFDRIEMARIGQSPESAAIAQRFDRAFESRKSAALRFRGGAARAAMRTCAAGPSRSIARRRKKSTPPAATPPAWWRKPAARRITATPTTSF